MAGLKAVEATEEGVAKAAKEEEEETVGRGRFSRWCATRIFFTPRRILCWVMSSPCGLDTQRGMLIGMLTARCADD